MGPFLSEINTVAELDEFLSRPDEALLAFMQHLDGDVMILGASGKMGPTLARMAKRAMDATGKRGAVIAVARSPLPELDAQGIQTIRCDLLDPKAARHLPRAENVVFMAGRKFGSTGNEPLTWAANAIVPYHVASTFVDSRIAVFSTGCVYPLMHVSTGGAPEETPVGPVGEYSMSCLARERMFDYFSGTHGERVVHIRLNYAVELRYGVLVDMALKVWNGQEIDLTTGYANVIWQGDACGWALRALELASSPPRILNVTGPGILSIREIAREFGRRFGKEPRFVREENGYAYLNNSSLAIRIFGPPSVSAEQMIEWISHWVRRGGETLGKPTHYETQDGRF
ncbi:MAG: NAD(P)-dependent oxidoreductase [Candidatus Sumerlaeota bacterium]|nr:NAD(P)-dependent oxidoreductase [Candidatus Sumerlaeota bacterium]